MPNRTAGEGNARGLRRLAGVVHIEQGRFRREPNPLPFIIQSRNSVIATFTTLLLWVFVINLGVAMGAGLYESRVVMPDWVNLARETWPNTGLKFWAYVTTIPLTLLTVLSLWASWHTAGAERVWWLAAALVIAVERAATFGYFIPAMIQMQGTNGVPDAQGKVALLRWLWLNTGRHILTLAGWLLALRALVLRG